MTQKEIDQKAKSFNVYELLDDIKKQEVIGFVIAYFTAENPGGMHVISKNISPERVVFGGQVITHHGMIQSFPPKVES